MWGRPERRNASPEFTELVLPAEPGPPYATAGVLIPGLASTGLSASLAGARGLGDRTQCTACLLQFLGSRTPKPTQGQVKRAFAGLPSTIRLGCALSRGLVQPLPTRTRRRGPGERSGARPEGCRLEALEPRSLVPGSKSQECGRAGRRGGRGGGASSARGRRAAAGSEGAGAAAGGGEGLRSSAAAGPAGAGGSDEYSEGEGKGGGRALAAAPCSPSRMTRGGGSGSSRGSRDRGAARWGWAPLAPPREAPARSGTRPPRGSRARLRRVAAAAAAAAMSPGKPGAGGAGTRRTGWRRRRRRRRQEAATTVPGLGRTAGPDSRVPGTFQGARGMKPVAREARLPPRSPGLRWALPLLLLLLRVGQVSAGWARAGGRRLGRDWHCLHLPGSTPPGGFRGRGRGSGSSDPPS